MTAATITEHEEQQIEATNASGLTPVVFVHGLWLLASSWDRWAALFEEAGYTALTPGWPDDPETVEEAQRASRGLRGQDRRPGRRPLRGVIRLLSKKPAVIGHSFGGLLTQILAGRGLSAASVAVDPAPFRGVLPLPISALVRIARARQSGQPPPRRAAHFRAVPLRLRQCRERRGGQGLYDTFAVPAPGAPLFQAAAANLNPWTEAKVDTRTPTAARC